MERKFLLIGVLVILFGVFSVTFLQKKAIPAYADGVYKGDSSKDDQKEDYEGHE